MIAAMIERPLPGREQGKRLSITMTERLYGQGAYQELHTTRQWLNWRYEFVNGEWKKAPYNPRNGHRASTTNPQTWGYLPQALKRLELGDMHGIGLAVSADDPYLIVDVDERQRREGNLLTGPLALEIFQLLETISEYSPNNGVHYLVKLVKPLPEAVKDQVEMYYTGRYMTVTADLVPNSSLAIAIRQEEIEQLFLRYKGYSFLEAEGRAAARGGAAGVRAGEGRPARRPVSTMNEAATWQELPPNQFDDESVKPTNTDEHVKHMMFSAANRDNILELWENRWQGNKRYTDTSGTPDDSRADLALVKYLLYWTGHHKTQTNRLFEESHLMRRKWRDRVNSGGSGHSYGEVTIVNCCNWLEAQAARKANAIRRE